MNQLERIIEVTGKPRCELAPRAAPRALTFRMRISKSDLAAIKSKFTGEMIDSINIKKQMCAHRTSTPLAAAR